MDPFSNPTFRKSFNHGLTKSIKACLKAIEKRYPVEEIQNLFNELTTGVRIIYDLNVPDFTLYRASALTDEEENRGDFKLKKRFSYCPADKSKIGRCNLPGATVFYGAQEGLGAQYEYLQNYMEISRVVYISEWKHLSPNVFKVFYVKPLIGDIEKSYDFNKLPKKDRALQKAYIKAITDLYAIPKYHAFTSYYSDMMFKNFGIDMIEYPSTVTNGQSTNFAIQPECIDAHWYITKVLKVETTIPDINAIQHPRDLLGKMKIIAIGTPDGSGRPNEPGELFYQQPTEDIINQVANEHKGFGVGTALSHAVNLYSEKDYEGAEKYCRIFLEKAPSDVEALSLLALIFEMQCREKCRRKEGRDEDLLNKAKDLYEKAHQINPNHTGNNKQYADFTYRWYRLRLRTCGTTEIEWNEEDFRRAHPVNC